MKPTNLNQLKNYLQVGMKLKLIDSSIKDHKFLNIERPIIKKQTNAIKFEGGSWFGIGGYMQEKASEFMFQDNGFIYTWDKGTEFEGFLQYEYIN